MNKFLNTKYTLSFSNRQMVLLYRLMQGEPVFIFDVEDHEVYRMIYYNVQHKINQAYKSKSYTIDFNVVELDFIDNFFAYTNSAISSINDNFGLSHEIDMKLKNMSREEKLNSLDIKIIR